MAKAIITLLVIIYLVSMATIVVYYENKLKTENEEKLDIHDTLYAQWANAVGYRDMLKQRCNITINTTEPFEEYYNGWG